MDKKKAKNQIDHYNLDMQKLWAYKIASLITWQN